MKFKKIKIEYMIMFVIGFMLGVSVLQDGKVIKNSNAAVPNEIVVVNIANSLERIAKSLEKIERKIK